MVRCYDSVQHGEGPERDSLAWGNTGRVLRVILCVCGGSILFPPAAVIEEGRVDRRLFVCPVSCL